MGETSATCPLDCPAVCGNLYCDSTRGETCATCAADCGTCCGNNVCDNGETIATCPGDCVALCEHGYLQTPDNGASVTLEYSYPGSSTPGQASFIRLKNVDRTETVYYVDTCINSNTGVQEYWCQFKYPIGDQIAYVTAPVSQTGMKCVKSIAFVDVDKNPARLVTSTESSGDTSIINSILKWFANLF
jgi:hypothetical protein